MNFFMCRVDCCCCVGWVGVNDQYIVSVMLIQFFCCVFFCIGIYFGDDFSQCYLFLIKFLIVYEYCWYVYDVMFGDFILEGFVVNCCVFDVWVEYCYQVQGLDYVWVVMIGE